MGPRASPLVCGYTHHHRLLESALAELKETEVHTFSKRIIVDTSLNLPIKNQRKKMSYDKLEVKESGAYPTYQTESLEAYIHDFLSVFWICNILFSCYSAPFALRILGHLFNMKCTFWHFSQLTMVESALPVIFNRCISVFINKQHTMKYTYVHSHIYPTCLSIRTNLVEVLFWVRSAYCAQLDLLPTWQS